MTDWQKMGGKIKKSDLSHKGVQSGSALVHGVEQERVRGKGEHGRKRRISAFVRAG